jgi:hypothetical protein
MTGTRLSNSPTITSNGQVGDTLFCSEPKFRARQVTEWLPLGEDQVELVGNLQAQGG